MPSLPALGRMTKQQGSHLLIKALILPIRVYQRTFSLLFAPTCRYTPSCSQYSIDALMKYGVFAGLGRAAKRILRCHPFSKHTHYDPA